jgi:hypothetical protein
MASYMHFINIVLWIHTSHLTEMLRSCKCFYPHMSKMSISSMPRKLSFIDSHLHYITLNDATMQVQFPFRGFVVPLKCIQNNFLYGLHLKTMSDRIKLL